MVANKKTHFFHLLKKLWQWGALACLINMMHYGVAMGQCVQPPTVTSISNNAPSGTVQLKRSNPTAFTLYTTAVEIDVTNCLTSSNVIRINTGLAATITNGKLTLSVDEEVSGASSCGTNNIWLNYVTNCKDLAGNNFAGRTGLNAIITIDVNELCPSKTGSISRVVLPTVFVLNSTCKKYKLTVQITRSNIGMELTSGGSEFRCEFNIFVNCITSGRIDYSKFVISNSSGVALFNLSSFPSVLPPVDFKYSDAPTTCAVTLPPLVVMPKMTPDKVTATTAGQAIPGTTIDLPITLKCQNADNQAKVFTWTFTTPSADGFSILNDPTLNIKGGVSSAGISAQIFSTIDLTGRDKVKFTENPTLVKNRRSYIATPTSNTTIVPHKVRLIRNSETTKEGTFISKATFTVDYQ